MCSASLHSARALTSGRSRTSAAGSTPITRIRRVFVRRLGSVAVCRSCAVAYSRWPHRREALPQRRARPPLARCAFARCPRETAVLPRWLGFTSTSSHFRCWMSAVLASSIAFMMPYCTPISTTANPMPAANSANRTLSWARLRQASGTGGGGGMGRSRNGRESARGVRRDEPLSVGRFGRCRRFHVVECQRFTDRLTPVRFAITTERR